MAQDDVARLGIEINSKDINTAIKRLDALEKQSGRTEGAAKGAGNAVKLIGGAAAIAGTVALTREIINTAASFEKLNASLKTVTGSQEAATAAMDSIKSLASETPFSVQQLTDSFIKLKAMGLDPSREAITSYGNTASAMGKDLNQMIEAVADAATGEFERLKEFGIKAKSEGDNVSFTFQGVTKTVKKNSEEIQQYLLDIGNTQFAGAMSEQMGTLDGHFSNLGDSADRLAVAIGEAGLSDAVKTLTGGLASMLNTMAEVIEIQKEPATDAMLTQKVAMRDLTEQLDATNKTYEYYLELQKGAANPEAAAVFQKQAEALKAQADEMQRAIDELSGTISAGTPVAEEETPAAAGGMTDKEREALEKRLEDLQTYYMSEQELALQSLLEKQELLTELEEAGIGQEEERRQLRLEATQEYEDALLQIAQDRINQEDDLKAKADAEERKRISKNTAFAIRMMEAGNKSATELLKGYLLDQAKMLGKTAIVGAYKWGAAAGGPIAGAAAAGAASLAVGALISAIEGSGDSGGGAAASGGSVVGEGGGIGTNQEVAQTPTQPAITFNLSGVDLDSPIALRSFVEKLQEAGQSGVKVIT